jgi:ABC-type transporter Mla subunit MlaD
VRRYFHGALKPPFNEEKRAEAGMPPDFYWPLAEERRRELANAIDDMQLNLRSAQRDRDSARAELATLQAELQAETGTVQTAASRERELARTLGFLTEALQTTASERDESRQLMAEALNEVEALNFQSALASERHERVFRQIEDAVAVSMEPLDEMFRAAGLPTDQIIGQVRATYSGQGRSADAHHHVHPWRGTRRDVAARQRGSGRTG